MRQNKSSTSSLAARRSGDARSKGAHMRRWLHALYSVSQVGAAACLFLICAAVVAQIIGRTVGYMVPSVPELAGFLLGATIFLSLPATLRANEHIRVMLIVERLPTRFVGIAEISYRVLGAGLAGFLSFHLLVLALESWEFGDRSAGLIGLPYWIFQAPMSFGLALLAVRFIEEIVIFIRSPQGLPSTAPVTTSAS